MEKREPSYRFQTRVEYILTEKGLPVFTPEEYQSCRDDIIYLLDTGKKNIMFYPWEREENVNPLPTLPGSPDPLNGGVEIPSSASVDSMVTSFPYPTDFDASDKETGDRVAVTIETGPELSNDDRVAFDGHVARFRVGEWTLAKGRSKESRKEAMGELFERVHMLAEKYRTEEEEVRKKDEERCVRREEAEEAAVE